jgi:hypothetical protein
MRESYGVVLLVGASFGVNAGTRVREVVRCVFFHVEDDDSWLHGAAVSCCRTRDDRCTQDVVLSNVMVAPTACLSSPVCCSFLIMAIAITKLVCVARHVIKKVSSGGSIYYLVRLC